MQDVFVPSAQQQSPARMPPIAIRAFTATTALGRGTQAQLDALHAQRSGLSRNTFGPHVDGAPLPCFVGRVDGLEDAALPAEWARWDCRNNRLAWMALQHDGVREALDAAIARHGATRVAVVLGTSTSAIGETEAAYTRLRDTDDGPRFTHGDARSIVHTPHSLGDFIAHATGARGPCITVATACSSSAKVFAQAARLIEAGVVDAALVGGVDTLCGSVLFGFNALQLVSTERCMPFDARRVGLSLGEAGGYAVLERANAADDVEASHGLQLRGYGESSDAHHMSAPHPQGLGAQHAMRDAIARAGIDAADVGYLNLHGTATPANDTAEARAVAAVFPDTLHASSTKGWTGHTLGAAGIVESVIALLALEHGVLPGILGSAQPDPECGPQIRFAPAQRAIDYAMNNSFGFGGNNCSLVFGRA